MAAIKKVPVQDVRAVFEQAADTIKAATENNVVVSKKELGKALDKIEDKRERALVQMLYNYAGYQDGDHLTTRKDVDDALTKNLDRLVDNRDFNGDGKIGNVEARALSKMGKIAFALAKSRIEGPVDPGPPQFGEMLDRAITSGVVKLDMRGNDIVGVKVDENYGDGGLPGEPELLGMVLDLPQAKKIEQINVGYIEEWDAGDSYEEAIQTIANRGPLPNLKNLFVGDFDIDQSEISWVDLGPADALLAAAPNMKDLKLRGAGIELRELRHDKLETLTFETGGLPAQTMGAIGRSQLPNLKKLEVWFGDSEYGFEGNPAALQPLLDGHSHPKLKQLGLQNAEFADAVIDQLANSRLVARLEVLDLSMGTLTDAGAQKLIDNKAAFEHLRTLNLDDNFLSEGTIDALKQAFGDKVSAKDQKEAWDDYRYVSVGE